MAHSFIYANKTNTERSVSVPDSTLHIFMYLFNTVSKQELGIVDFKKNVICNHYELELKEVHTSYIDLMLNEININLDLRSWYSSMLSKIENLLNTNTDILRVDNLNQSLRKSFNETIPKSTLENLINDVFWVLFEKTRKPSKQYLFFEENVR